MFHHRICIITHVHIGLIEEIDDLLPILVAKAVVVLLVRRNAVVRRAGIHRGSSEWAGTGP